MLTLSSALRRTRQHHAASIAIRDEECTLTWADFVGRVEKAAGALKDLGLQRGERLGVLSRNSFRQAELLHAAYWIGVVPVPINWRLAAPEIAFILDDADCRSLFVEDRGIPILQDSLLARWKEKIVYVSAQRADVKWPQYEDLLGAADPGDPVDVDPEDDAILLYTGGTTGRSKGVRLAHRNVMSNALQLAVALRARSDDVALHVSPMFHSADLYLTAYTLVGASHVYLPDFTPSNLLQAIERFGVTTTMLAPTAILMTLQDPDLPRFDTSGIRRLFYGSAPMDVERIRQAMEAFPAADLQQGYGLTETSPILTTLDPEEHVEALKTGDLRRLRSCGRALIGTEITIRDDDGNEVPVGATGEVVVRGPQVTKGYLNRPEENEKAFRKGWFHTGDVGRMDAEGFLYLLDRKKDMIVSGGENVYCAEVESALHQHADVSECAVFGIPDERWGEAVAAAIVAVAGARPTEDEIIAHCRKRIGNYKIPRRIVFVDALPKTAVGKVQKSELRRLYGETD